MPLTGVQLTVLLPNMQCKYLIIALTSLVVLQASAQQTYSLQQCIETAFNNNITIKQRALNQQSAKADVLQSKLNLLPNLNGQVTNNYSIGFAINPVTNTTTRDATFRNNTFGLNSSVVLFNGFQNINTIRQQSSNAQATEADLAATKNNIALSVSNAYLQVLLNKEVLNARVFQLNGTAEQLKRQEKLFELGGINKVRFLQLKAQMANEESQVIAAKTQLDQAYLNLWQLMNITPDTNNQVITPDSISMLQLTAETAEANQIYNTFKSQSPELRAAQKRREAAAIGHTVAAGGRSPRLTLSGGLNSFYTTQNQQGVGDPTITLRPVGVDAIGNPAPYFVPITTYSQSEVVPFGTQFNRNIGKNFGFTLSVPIFNGWQVSTNVQKAKINEMSNELNQKQTEQDVFKNVNQAYLDYQSAQKRYEANMRNYEANAESFELAQTQFDLGAVNAADFIVTKNQFLQAQTTMLQARYELLLRKKVLDFYLGKPLY